MIHEQATFEEYRHSSHEEIPKTEEEWRRKLTDEEYRALREKETEPPFSGKYVSTKEKGMYRCRACGAALFSSDAKFDSGTGWPSFTEPANRQNIELKENMSQGMRRTEVLCARCGSHLGHVFDDGPEERDAKPRIPTPAAAEGGKAEAAEIVLRGKRYCINSVCLALEKQDERL